ncbi:MAG: four helix bundle protein [Candidatus Brocadiaceae bacterium]|nr:four helix bundle protein [Candidatus Brocadiaceae bacterium]
MENAVKSVEDMDVFKKAHKITVEIYEITKTFPQDEKFALISQMRRAAYSIPSNLMEGGHRINKKEYRQFTNIAKGSVGELKYFLLLSKDLGYISENKYSILRQSVDELSKMLGGLIKSLTVTDH